MAMRLQKLNEKAQEFAVCALACFETPSAVAKALKKEFGVSITPQSVQSYDATKRAGERLSPRWRNLFEETRARFLRETADIGIAHKVVRLKALQRMADAAEGKKQYALAAQLLEQAAKEVGNAFTNARVISGPQGRAIQLQTIRRDFTAQEAADAWHAIMNSDRG